MVQPSVIYLLGGIRRTLEMTPLKEGEVEMGPWGAGTIDAVKVHRPREWAEHGDDLGVRRRNTFCTFYRCHRGDPDILTPIGA